MFLVESEHVSTRVHLPVTITATRGHVVGCRDPVPSRELHHDRCLPGAAIDLRRPAPTQAFPAGPSGALPAPVPALRPGGILRRLR